MSETDYTPDEIAAKLQRSRDHIVKLLRAGQIPGAYQLAPRGHWRVRREDFDIWRHGLHSLHDPHRLEPPLRRSNRKKAS